MLKDNFFDHAQSSSLWNILLNDYRQSEAICLKTLVDYGTFSSSDLDTINTEAKQWILTLRNSHHSGNRVNQIMQVYGLMTPEGLALMGLAESLLRIPDKAKQRALIQEKLENFDARISANKKGLVWGKLASQGLAFATWLLSSSVKEHSLKAYSQRVLQPGLYWGLGQAMGRMGNHFVLGQTIQSALRRSRSQIKLGFRYSYDMLGESAKTMEDAERYFQSYLTAIQAIGADQKGLGIYQGSGISIKLSALHPRYEWAQKERVMSELLPCLLSLAQAAKERNIGLTIDAEESERLMLSLILIEALALDPSLAGWQGLGLAVQAYQKRAFVLIDWLGDLAKRSNRKIMLRLVKGAYWDSEIKHCQELGLADYPVFTRKEATDVSYLACAKKILAYGDLFYPQFATHNPLTIASILALAREQSITDFEFQCLHGMGEDLYRQVIEDTRIPCRIYAPVGTHQDLLAYLVRRLLENGANTSFVYQMNNPLVTINSLLTDPYALVQASQGLPHPKIPLPADLYPFQRKNAQGFDMSDERILRQLKEALAQSKETDYIGLSIIDGKQVGSASEALYNPANHQDIVGYYGIASPPQLDEALTLAFSARQRWDSTPVLERAACLDRAADLLTERAMTYLALLVREAGKTLTDAIADWREAIDFCRYYAEQARQRLAHPTVLQGVTGETNHLYFHGRGLILCISPWNFPLAILLGQMTAALVAGNTVIAKPAEQTPLIATLATQLLHEAGIPADVLQLILGPGETIGTSLVRDPRVAGVMFTGSNETAQHISRDLAQRSGPLVPLIAETGGQNVMIVDSTALAEQVVSDVLISAFGSAGQRCSALRVLYLQDDIAEKVMTMLRGAMSLLTVGDPGLPETDVGPVIDKTAQAQLEQHLVRMQKESLSCYQLSLLEKERQKGCFFSPVMVEINHLNQLDREVFGPFLHIIRYRTEQLDEVLTQINESGYGLTLGIHSRLNHFIEYIHRNTRVGNTYVNRSMIGAVVGVQPFGGEGLSGTGPKAGGPNYLPRLCVERTLTVNTTAAGGNTSLICQEV